MHCHTHVRGPLLYRRGWGPITTYPARVLAVAFVPHPPALVPELCGGSVDELADVRDASSAAVDRLLASGPDLIRIVGTGPSQRWYGAGDVGNLAPFGRPLGVQVAGAAGPDGARLPLSLTVGAWLLDQAGYDGQRLALSVPVDATDDQLDDLAEQFAGRAAGVVMGDGSATRHAEAPAAFHHPEAVPFDDAVAAALAAGDAAALFRLDPCVGTQVQAQGVGAWRLAGRLLRDVEVGAELLYYGAPFGVGYVVAVWTPLPC